MVNSTFEEVLFCFFIINTLENKGILIISIFLDIMIFPSLCNNEYKGYKK